MTFTLDYFKASGKWYTTSEVTVEADYFYDGIAKLREMLAGNDVRARMHGAGALISHEFHIVAYDQESGSQHLILGVAP